MKPYKNLSSFNLSLLLTLARVMAILGIVLVLLSLIIIVIVIYSSGFLAVTTGLVFIPMSVSVLFLSGLMAAVVAFEENYRIRTEHLVSDTKK